MLVTPPQKWESYVEKTGGCFAVANLVTGPQTVQLIHALVGEPVPHSSGTLAQMCLGGTKQTGREVAAGLLASAPFLKPSRVAGLS